jgi:hypothetical protein
MKYIKNRFKDQRGISIIETVWVMVLIGMVIAIVGPLFRQFMIGNPAGEGFAGRIMESQTQGVDESSHGNITLVEDCNITVANCNNVKN